MWSEEGDGEKEKGPVWGRPKWAVWGEAVQRSGQVFAVFFSPLQSPMFFTLTGRFLAKFWVLFGALAFTNTTEAQ